MKLLFKLFSLIALTSLVVAGVFAQGRGVDHEDRVGTTVTPRGKQWAVFIAIDEYREWGPLKYPVKDAKDIKKILLDHYYIDESCIRELYNSAATKAAILRLFTDLQNETEPNDSVFVFHAGHGTDGEDIKTPAWIPYDGSRDIVNQGYWLYHSLIRSLLDSMKARHVFLISDSCYSGELLAAPRGIPETFTDYPAAYNNVSRQVMSSGASEEVEDESEFASRLKSLLLRTETPYITPLFLCSQIIEEKTMRPLLTIPNLGPMPQSGHKVGGSFLFFRKNPSVVQSDPPPLRPELRPRPTPDQKPGTAEFFIGTWEATTKYNNSFDTYRITFSAPNNFTIRIENDIAQQETTGNWTFINNRLSLNNAVFRNAKITYQKSIKWNSQALIVDNNTFRMFGKATSDENSPQVTFEFHRKRE